VNVRERIRATGAVAILRLRDHALGVELGHALAEGGLEVMELTLDHPQAVSALRSMADALPERVLLGAGTLRHPEQVAEAADAGARFCVSPHTAPTLIDACLGAGLEPLPGAFTATEVTTALDAGARLVKIFPAGPLGPDFLRILHAPLETAEFLPTGGIRHDAVAAWLVAGAAAVGLGSDLVPSVPTAADVDGVHERARVVTGQVAEVRGRGG
jgi:2-dehydro-3-deoxyphosphogluconate aldolase / (4S)-4-hydroxy-2-oxoglutarate aldolase